MWRSQPRMFFLALVLSVIGYSCGEDPSSPPVGPSSESYVHGWSWRFGDVNSQIGHSAAVDASGNVIVTGGFVGSVDFGGGVLTNVGLFDIFVAKFDTGGNHIWSKRFGDASEQLGRSAAVDGSGNVIVTGSFFSNVDFGGGVLTSEGFSDIFVAKFDAGGNHIWSQRFGNALVQGGARVAVDASGNVIMTGGFVGSVDFGGGALTSAGSSDIFVAKFDAGGNHIWSQRFGDASDQGGSSLAVDASGNVIVEGPFRGSVDFGGGDLTSAGGDIFVAKFDAGGNHSWSKKFGTTGVACDLCGSSVTVDVSGNVILTGNLQGGVDFGGGVLTSVGNSDIFVAKFDAGGDHVWSKRFGDGNDLTGQIYRKSAAADVSGNVILTGNFNNSMDFGGGVLTGATGAETIFLAKFDTNGNHIWSERYGSTGDQVAQDILIDASGSVIITGYFFFSLDFGGGELTSAGAQDVFVAKFLKSVGGN